MTWFAITASVTTHTVASQTGGVEYSRTEQLPTFYLNGNVQGFFTEAGGAEIARRILDPFAQYADGDLIITVCEVTTDAIIATARDLRSEDGENPEYDRALVELTSRLLGLDDETGVPLAREAVLG